MKKAVILICIAAAAVGVAFLLILSNLTPAIFPLKREDIKEVQISTHTASRALTEQEIAEFITLYSAASYGEKINGQGGTPDWILSFTLVKNNKAVSLNDFHGKFEPSGLSAGRYLESEVLYEFAGRLAETIAP